MTLTRRPITVSGLVAGVLVLAVSLMSGTASAASFWGGSGSGYQRPAGSTDGWRRCVHVDVQGLIGTAQHPSDSTAGWANVLPQDFKDTNIRRLQIDKIVLGTQYGVLTTSGLKNSGDV